MTSKEKCSVFCHPASGSFVNHWRGRLTSGEASVAQVATKIGLLL
jgi:hypothetical protein